MSLTTADMDLLLRQSRRLKRRQAWKEVGKVVKEGLGWSVVLLLVYLCWLLEMIAEGRITR